MKGTIRHGPRDVRLKDRAVPMTAVTHIAIQEQRDGKAVDWMEKGQRRPIGEVNLSKLQKEIL
jgi:hypothetical protein